MAHTVRAATKSQRSHDLSYFGSHRKIGRNDLTDDLRPEFCGVWDIFEVIFGSLFYIFCSFLLKGHLPETAVLTNHSPLTKCVGITPDIKYEVVWLHKYSSSLAKHA